MEFKLTMLSVNIDQPSIDNEVSRTVHLVTLAKQEIENIGNRMGNFIKDHDEPAL